MDKMLLKSPVTLRVIESVTFKGAIQLKKSNSLVSTNVLMSETVWLFSLLEMKKQFP